MGGRLSRFHEQTLERLRQLLAKRAADQIDDPRLRRAAVLIPIVCADGIWSIIFSVRAEGLTVHSGQISFPGGSLEQGETVEDAAVREMEEEIGVTSDQIELIGRLDDLVSVTDFLVSPIVGVVNDEARIAPDAREVASVFTVPIDALLEPQEPQIRHLAHRGGVYPVYFYLYGEYQIWGLTGRILKSFLDLVQGTV